MSQQDYDPYQIDYGYDPSMGNYYPVDLAPVDPHAMGESAADPSQVPGTAPAQVVPHPQAPQGPVAPGWLKVRKLGIPYWAWILGLGAAGYYLYHRHQKKKLEANDDETPRLGSGDDWAPSRSRFASNLERYLSEKKARAKVFHDADDAKKAGVKNPSPLVNVKVSRASKLHEDKSFRELAASEGLEPVRLDETTVGLVPAKNGDRGREWEKYIDALRDEGQEV